MSERMAFWVDLDNPYVTLHNDFIESSMVGIKTNVRKRSSIQRLQSITNVLKQAHTLVMKLL